MKTHALLLLSAALLLASCADNRPPSDIADARTFTEADFRQTVVSPRGEAVGPRQLLNPMRILVFDSLLLTVDINTEKAIHVWSLKTGELLNEFCVRGRAANEVFGIASFTRHPDGAHLNAGNASRILFYPLEGLLTPDLQPDAIYNSPEPLLSPQLTADGNLLGAVEVPLFGGDTLSAPARFRIQDRDGRLLDTFGSYPEVLRAQLNERVVRHLMGGYPLISEDGKQVALLGLAIDFLEIYDLDTRRRTALMHGPEIIPPGKKPDADAPAIGPVQQMCYLWPQSAGGRIWALYKGQRFYREIAEAKDFRRNATVLLSFDWNGRPHTRYQFDHGIIHFDIDARNRCIYVLHDIDGEHRIMRYAY
ncbi:MAG: hypothetical protein J6K95_03045 [Rikenellaceae bacterium]|nr:hypothetical protein [Rikenellaceae bacterium]